ITLGNKAQNIVFEGEMLNDKEQSIVRNLIRISNHPLSRKLYDFLPEGQKLEVENFDEITGKGIQGIIQGQQVKVGSASFVGAPVKGGSAASAGTPRTHSLQAAGPSRLADKSRRR